MSLIVHRCTVCRHPDIWADGTTIEPVNRTATSVIGATQRTRCGQEYHRSDTKHHRGNCTWGPPELLLELAPLTAPVLGAPVTTIRSPGTRLRGFNRSCNCEACKAFYIQQVTKAERAEAGAR